MAITKTGGTTITGATFGAIANVTGLNWSGENRPPVDSTDFGTANAYMTNEAADFTENPTIVVDVNYVGSINPFSGGATAEVWTIDPAANSLTTAISGYVSGYSIQGELNGKFTAQITIQTSANPTRTLV